nr:CHAT domain-containing protein [uncultured Actinoplanes sp.]
MTSPDFVRLAEAVRLLEDHRGRVRRLNEVAARLAGFDVIVVAGEQAVLERLGRALDTCQELLTEMAVNGDGAAALDRLEQLVRRPWWSVLKEVQDQLTEKEEIAATARAEVEPKLARWSDIASRVEAASQQIQLRRLRVAEPRRLASSRSRLTALVRQANASFKENRLVDVWRALSELERAPATNGSPRPPVPPQDVPYQLEKLLKRASPGPLQLTVLRGPLKDDHIEYTLMLLTPTGDQYVGINVQDTSTIVKYNHERFLREAEQAGRVGYRALRDAAPPEGVAAPPDENHLARLRDMGHILYRLVIPTGMREVIESQPAAPLVVITNDRALSWELMFAEDFVALQRPLARMPVGRSGARRTLSAEPAVRHRRVALVASTGGDRPLPSARHEVELIAEGLEKSWGNEVDVDMFVTGTDRPADGENFERVLIAGNYDVIHYAGHARYDGIRADQSGLTLDHDEPCSAEKILRLVRGAPLVFLNACETARINVEPPEGARSTGEYAGDPREGLASAFLYGGALACIGNSWPVPDTIAADFAVTFYTNALEGLPLGEAMRVARKVVAERYPHDPSWASFVFYGDPGFSLGAFDNLPAPRPSN